MAHVFTANGRWVSDVPYESLSCNRLLLDAFRAV